MGDVKQSCAHMCMRSQVSTSWRKCWRAVAPCMAPYRYYLQESSVHQFTRAPAVAHSQREVGRK